MLFWCEWDREESSKMIHIKMQLADIMGEALRTLAQSKGLDASFSQAELEKALEAPPQSEMGDYAFVCFRFAKPLATNPVELAKSLAEVLSQPAFIGVVVARMQLPFNFIDAANASGPFLNIRVRYDFFSQDILEKFYHQSWDQHWQGKSPVGSQAKKIMVEYSQPNTHKEFHIGHARNVCLGDALIRLMRYGGDEVLAVNYIGDEGTHIAKCLFQLEQDYPDFLNIPPQVSLLGKSYAKADQFLADAADADKATAQEKISEILSGIESKSGKYFEMWKITRQWSLDEFYRIYDLFNVHFDHYFFESEVSEESQEIVDEFLKKGIFIESEGAIGIDLSAVKLGFLILRKRDGNTLYATKDLALHRRKFEEFGVDESVVVTAEEQKYHFQQVFKTLDLMGFKQAAQCYHLSYGMVVRPEGKMSSRKGNSVTFDELLAQMEQGVREVMQKNRDKWTEPQFEAAVHKLAMGAMKYGMIQADPNLRIVFDLESWLSFEGNSGPYLMYAYARTQSMLRKAADLGIEAKAKTRLYGESQTERDLVRYMHDFDEIITHAVALRKPSVLCHHLYSMCKTFGKFYVETPILKDENTENRAARVYLLQCFANVLRKGLELLGIEALEEM